MASVCFLEAEKITKTKCRRTYGTPCRSVIQNTLYEDVENHPFIKKFGDGNFHQIQPKHFTQYQNLNPTSVGISYLPVTVGSG